MQICKILRFLLSGFIFLVIVPRIGLQQLRPAQTPGADAFMGGGVLHNVSGDSVQIWLLECKSLPSYQFDQAGEKLWIYILYLEQNL